MPIELVQRRSRLDAAFNGEFCRALILLRLPAQDPSRIPLLRSLVRSSLCPARSLWMARDGRETVGTVGASLHTQGNGYIGFLEVAQERHDALEISALLVATAERWLRLQGAARVLGPVTLSTWFSYRARTDEDPRSFAWEPGAAAAVVEALRAAGYAVATTYHTFGAGDPRRCTAAWRPAVDNAVSRGVLFESVPAPRITSGMVRDLHRITLAAFRGSYLFDPIGYGLFRRLYVPPLADPSIQACLHFAREPGGEPVAYLLTLREGRALVFKSIAVLPRAQGRKLSFALMAFAADRALGDSQTVASPPTEAIFALVRDGSVSEAFTRSAAEAYPEHWWHRYALFARTLS
jgi:GNAT superfamily N-acetyltransferase